MARCTCAGGSFVWYYGVLRFEVYDYSVARVEEASTLVFLTYKDIVVSPGNSGSSGN
jgi:hypothetical protein